MRVKPNPEWREPGGVYVTINGGRITNLSRETLHIGGQAIPPSHGNCRCNAEPIALKHLDATIEQHEAAKGPRAGIEYQQVPPAVDPMDFFFPNGRPR